MFIGWIYHNAQISVSFQTRNSIKMLFMGNKVEIVLDVQNIFRKTYWKSIIS